MDTLAATTAAGQMETLNVQVAVFWVVLPYVEVVGHRRLAEPSCLHLHT